MSKNKFMKKLLIAGLCAVTATAMIGATACKEDKPDEEGKHVHNYATTWSSDKDGHWHACLNAGHTEAYTKLNHVDANSDNKCDECQFVLTDGEDPDNPDNPDNPDVPVAKATEKVKVDVSTLSTLADGDSIGTDSGISAAGALTVESNAKKVLYNGEEIAVSNRLKISGTGKFENGKASNSIKFDIAKDNSVIIVYAYSGSSGEVRSLALKDSEFADIEAQEIGNGNFMGTAIFEVATAGTYYVTSTNKGINLYYIAVWEGGKLEETTVETKAAADATCTTPGNIAYTKTNFGRFKDSSGKIIGEHEVSSPARNHAYELDNTTLAAPTKETEGSIKVLCNNDHAHDYVFELPVLTDAGYVHVTEGQEAGKALYGYSIPGTGLTVSFVADVVTQAQYKFVNIYENVFSTAIPSVGYGVDNAHTLAEGLKMYGLINGSATEYSTGITQEVTAAGRLEVKDTNSTDTAYNYIVFDQAKTSGVYKISGTLHMPTQNGSWSIFQLIGSNVQSVGDPAFAAIRSQGDKKLGITAANSNTDVTLTTAASYTAGTDYNFEIVLNLDSKTVTLKIGEEVVVSDANAVSIAASLGENGWQGIRLQTAGGSRNVFLSGLTIAERVVDEG